MPTSTSAMPLRSFGVFPQLATLVSTEVRRLVRSRKTLVLGLVQLIPVVAALVYVVFKDLDGLSMYRGVMELVSLPFLVPLAALFYGGPAVVDEMEGRTLTYLTMRPLSRVVLFWGKLVAGQLVALLVVLVPQLLLFGLCLGTSSDLGASWTQLGQSVLASALGVMAYTAVFGALGAAFATSLVGGIVYFVVSEMVLSALPVLELLSVRFYLRAAGGWQSGDRLGMLDRLVLDAPLVLEWWAGALVAALVAGLAGAIGGYIFQERVYHV